MAREADPIDRAIAAATAAQLAGRPLKDSEIYDLLRESVQDSIGLLSLSYSVLTQHPDAILPFFLALRGDHVDRDSVWPEFLGWLVARGVTMQVPALAVRAYVQGSVIKMAVQWGSETAGQGGDNARRELAEKLIEIMRGQKDTLPG